MEVASPRRSSSSSSSSPEFEFEFWIPGVGGSQRHPDILTADELFVDGILLPLHLISLNNHSQDDVLESKLKPGIIGSSPAEAAPAAEPGLPEASICVSTCPNIVSTSSTSSISSSKRWTDIFKKKEQQQPAALEDNKEKLEKLEKKKKKKKERKTSGSSAAELNINIWPFSRSRSAGTAAGRPRPAAAAAARKSSSAPCSRSNSRGENSSGGGARRWAPSPGRGGVHVGRASPVWQARRTPRGGPEEKKHAGIRRGLNGGGLSLNVNSCIGLNGMGSSSSSCRGEEGRAAVNGNGGGVGGLFRIRALFTKKVY